eukprot:11586010-Alexandrium_andersonii.AAC.1
MRPLGPSGSGTPSRRTGASRAQIRALIGRTASSARDEAVGLINEAVGPISAQIWVRYAVTAYRSQSGPNPSTYR